jgi:Tfp pilus assembly protein PilW
MDCTITSYSLNRSRRRGMTLVELQIASAIAVILFAAVMALAFYTARSFAAFTNYVDLDVNSRNALDVMSTEIRQADLLTAATSTSLTFQTTDPNTGAQHVLKYAYDSTRKELTRVLDGGQPDVLLTECSFLQFGTFQRNTTPSLDNAFVPVTTSQANLCKVVQLTWICSRKILGKSVNTESVQSAKVVIRKK